MIDRVCAGIVLYNPDINRLKENIEAVSGQVDKVVLVDNSSQNKKDISLILSNYTNINIIWNQRNIGIAAALNQIADYANNNCYSWALLLDQDSVVCDGLIKLYRQFFNDNQISIICPQIIDINHITQERTGVEQIKCSTDVITSGSCIRIDDWITLSGFNEELFIDFVDTDYQERCLRSGKKIIRINDAHLKHEIGSLKERHFFCFKVLCSNHNPVRRYYMVRNRLYFRYHYFGKLSYLKEYFRLLFGTFKIIIFEDQKLAKIKAFNNGFRDSKKLIKKYDKNLK